MSISKMSPLTRELVAYQRKSTQEGMLGGRVVTAGVSVVLHVEAVYRAGYVFFLTIQDVFSKSDQEWLADQKRAGLAAYSLSWDAFCSTFSSRPLPKEEEARAEAQAPPPSPSLSASTASEWEVEFSAVPHTPPKAENSGWSFLRFLPFMNLAAAPSSEREPLSPLHDAAQVQAQLEKELRLAAEQLKREVKKEFTLTRPPSYLSESEGWKMDQSSLGGYAVGHCSFSDPESKIVGTHFASHLPITIGGQVHELFFAAAVEAPKSSKAAIYLRNHLQAALVEMLQMHNPLELSVVGIRNSLHLLFDHLQKKFALDFEKTKFLDHEARVSLVVILDGAVWSVNLGDGSIVYATGDETAQLTVKESADIPSFSGTSNVVPRITVSPLRPNAHLTLVPSALIQSTSAAGLAEAIRRAGVSPQNLAFASLHTVRERERTAPSYCVVIQTPRRIKAIGSSGVHQVHVTPDMGPQPEPEGLDRELGYSSGPDEEAMRAFEQEFAAEDAAGAASSKKEAPSFLMPPSPGNSDLGSLTTPDLSPIHSSPLDAVRAGLPLHASRVSAAKPPESPESGVLVDKDDASESWSEASAR